MTTSHRQIDENYSQHCLLRTIHRPCTGRHAAWVSSASSGLENLQRMSLLTLPFTSPQDLQLDSTSNPSCLRLQIKCSKTDPFRQGCFIYLHHGCTSICPIASVMAYLHLRSPTSGPLFLHKDGHPPTRAQLSNFLQSTLSAAGITESFSGHIFRIGAAITATQQGLPDHLIKTMGHWSSDTYQLYIRTPVQSILNVSGWLL